MKQKIFYLVSIAALLSLTSCNGFLLERVYFSEADEKYIDKHSFEIVTNYPCDIIELKEFSAKPEIKGTIPAKTRLKVLAMQGEYGETLTLRFSLNPNFIVELPDGSRKLIKSLEAFSGFRAKTKDSDEWQSIDKVVIEKNKKGEQYPKFTVGGKETVVEKLDIDKFPRYYGVAGGNKKISIKTVEQKFVGKTLKKVEQKLMLADYITVNGKTQTAYFSGYSIQQDSIYLSPLALTVENGTVTAIDYTGKTGIAADENNEQDKSGWLSGTYDYLRTHTFMSLTFFSSQWIKSNSWLKIIRPPGTWRFVISIILNILLVLITLVFLFPWLIKKALFYIKPLSNETVTILGKILYILLAIRAYFFFGMITFDIWGIVISLAFFGPAIWIGYTFIKDLAESDRCPYCHTVDKVVFVGKSNERTSYSESERTDSEYVADKQVTEYTNGRKTGGYTTGHYEQVTRKTRTKHKNWKDNLHCNACGKDIVYSRYESDSDTWETGRSR